MTSELLTAEWASHHYRELGFGGPQLQAGLRWNPGGFGSLSFTVTDGTVKRHVKMRDAEHAPQLHRWARHHRVLEGKYRAPRLLLMSREEILPGYVCSLWFEHIEGTALEEAPEPRGLLEEILPCVSRLHRDEELAGALRAESADSADTGQGTCADAFEDIYIRRFSEDIQVIEEERRLLPFVSDETLSWFSQEVQQLAAAVRAHPSFKHPAECVVHNDLHWNNVLVRPNREWAWIDWDDLSAGGDPAADYATLLWPALRLGESVPMLLEQAAAAGGAEAAGRLPLYFRAALLDEVIDVLADYIEAEEQDPVLRTRTRERAQRIHLSALEQYRRQYS